MIKGECKGRAEELLGLPEKLEKRLLPFQRHGVQFALSRAGRCLIADEMGLGKTVQAISVAYLYRHEWPLLIVVPSSLKYPWIEELERWVPELHPDDINLVESKANVIGISQSKVTVLGYGLLTNDAQSLVDALKKQHFGVVIVDESHYLKSRNAARTKILVPVIQNAKRAILLTGTPALGRPEELFMQIDALYPRRFGTWSEYAKKYCNAHYRFFGRRRQWDCRGASHLDELHQRLSEIMIRRLKAEVLTQLPAKIRQRIPFDLPKEAAKEASSSLETWESLMRSLGSGESENENPFTQVMALITQMYKQTAVAKAGAVKDYIKMMLETEQLKFLVFAHHLSMLQACTEAVIEAKAGYIRIDGSVPSAERIQLVHRFQNDPETRVAILSIQAAGQGLTLTAASHVVFAELYWNPGHVKQAEDRAHRIGQTSSVHVHYLIAKGTFDMVMWAMLNRKFERDKQHDIRSFFSPVSDKKRKRTDDASITSSPHPPSQDQQGTNQSPCGHSPDLANQEEDFCPQVKHLKQTTTPLSRCGGKRSPAMPLGAPRRLSTGMQTPHHCQKWSCPLCTFSNSGLLLRCEMCETPRARRARSPPASPSPSASLSVSSPCITLSDSEEDNSTPRAPQTPLSTPSQTIKKEDKKTSEPRRDPPHTPSSTNDSRESEPVDDSLPVYDSLKFCASKNTDRIYIYNKDGLPLNCNFVPLDIRLHNWDDLPPEFSRTENRRHLVRFVREWSFLTAMKQRMVRKTGRVFHSPTLLVDELTHTQRRHSSTKRYLSKQEVAETSLSAARRQGGTVRSISKDSSSSFKRSIMKAPSHAEKESGAETGYLQALDSGGTPLCLSCQKPSVDHSGWAGGFCSASCMEDLQLRSSRGYSRSRVLETEQGVCQSCGLNARQVYLHVRDAPHTHRKEILDNTWLAQLPLKQLNEMIRHPVEGHFWQVDHIKPVYSGGGQCLLDNLQTLCTVCHRMRTAQQAKERSQTKKSEAASKLSSDITRFFMKK
ncbi:DNA annealing helicase and endonuclease ZRANB3 isoform X2 [Neoarius graeffei]|uniref:DNA annealing helicase and endonuclease ZRANB3 isoform X2 n=1 Tax=Neoarius graeffei TaxID=443677 RepID=UPI00298C7067|nr:DNA annealing helicase and endonuclease ZRANB3 isoform X2 [Neoarius graeffei]